LGSPVGYTKRQKGQKVKKKSDLGIHPYKLSFKP